MNQNLLDNIKKTIEGLEASGILTNARIFLFGMNTPGDRIIQYLDARGYKVESVLDNNTKNQGQILLGVPVCPPDILKSENPDNIRVLIASRYYREMCTQLEKMGLKENDNIIKLIEFESGIRISDSREAFEQASDRLRKCAGVYNRITEDFDENTHFLLCPIRANGDMYIAASLMPGLREKYKTNKVFLVAVGGISRKIAAMFDEEDCLPVSQEDMDALVYIAEVMGSSITRMHMFYPKAFSYGIYANMECYKGLNYMDLTAGGMLGLDMKMLRRTKAAQVSDRFNQSGRQSNEADAVNGSKSLNSKDVILAPYANSLPCFPLEFWERLVQALNEEGFKVYTNSNGDMEPAVAGTEPIFLPIREMPAALGKCAAFIAIRNGLCDVVAEAQCRKIIIYPNKGMGFGDVLDFYGLNAMGMCDDAVELVYSEKKECTIIKTIINTLA